MVFILSLEIFFIIIVNPGKKVKYFLQIHRCIRNKEVVRYIHSNEKRRILL